MIPDRFNFCLLLFLALGFAGCSDRQTEQPVMDAAGQYAYFPLRIGKSITYVVDSVVFGTGPGGVLRDSSRIFLQETVVDTLRDNTGQLIYLVERSERRSDTSAWQLKNVWSAARTTNQAVRTEDNLRFLRLIFPMDERSDWDGNRWIDPQTELVVAGESLRPFSGWRYRVDSLDVSLAVGAFVFDSALVVTETDEENLFERRFSKAVYAKKLGLVRREQWFLDSQYCNRNPAPPDCATKPWEEKAERGFIVKMIVFDFN